MKTSQSAARSASGNRPGGTSGPADPDASTRQRVASSILEQGPSTAAALAERLGLTPAAIRRHLDMLTERGIVESREQRVYGARGRGRPARVFAITDAGRMDFHHAYDDLAIEALEYLSETGGSAAVRGFAERRLAGAEQRYRTALAETAADSPTAALAEALTTEGYVASTRRAVAGEQLCQHHCPVAHVAERFPELCEAETEAFARVLGVHVQRLATIAHGDGVCTTHVPDLTPRPAPDSHAPADPNREARG
ncbi:helix-turn-helix transcriptional regulator [Auraticoccus monumenti]|uniref:Predicted transcriptional regulator, ArsR family n=1 Tax=Auraticoccus monumenti TaxID=675864 RepID=A0A1G7DG10_9ACTN|nr:metalloregulator ArsR/SmtB family transcription factor [Auraticoccus monumenti]SDE50389.1 Predicted transcriptional regulator, ArsR family [Auraticoccus monumenti]